MALRANFPLHFLLLPHEYSGQFGACHLELVALDSRQKPCDFFDPVTGRGLGERPDGCKF